MNISVLGFGGAEIGFEGASVDTVAELLNSALDAGLNIIDTAECYVGSEELIGKVVSHRRNDYYLFTKCGHNGSYENNAWSKNDIEKSIERSLKHLRTDHLDLVQLHSCSLDVLKRGEAIEALEKAKKEGKTRFIGYSGDNEEAAYAVESGAFDTLQISISVADQLSLDKILPLARARQIGVIAKRPVANAAWKSKSRPNNPYIVPYWERFQKLQYDFCSGDLGEAVSHALRFTLSADGVHTAIVGTAKPRRWLENAQQVGKGKLSQTEIEKISRRWSEVATADWIGQV